MTTLPARRKGEEWGGGVVVSSIGILARVSRFCVRPVRVVVLVYSFFAVVAKSGLDYGFDPHFVTWTPPCRRVVVVVICCGGDRGAVGIQDEGRGTLSPVGGKVAVAACGEKGVLRTIYARE